MVCRFLGVSGVPFGRFPGVLTMKSWVDWSKTFGCLGHVIPGSLGAKRWFPSRTVQQHMQYFSRKYLVPGNVCWRFASIFRVPFGCLRGAFRVTLCYFVPLS
eukprot:7099155-Pyramimonas_sp.AAC.1